MKKESIVTLSAISLVTLAAVAGFSYYAFAASSSGANFASSTNPFGFARHWQGRNLTAEQQAKLAAKQAAAKVERDAELKALEANDYNAWVAAMRQINPNMPILTRINADNFSKLSEANSYLEKAETIMNDLGLTGLGKGGRGGFDRMMGGGMMGGWGR